MFLSANRFHYSLFAFVILFFLSCSQEYGSFHEEIGNNIIKHTSTTKVLGETINYSVSIKDAYKYASSYRLYTGFEIEPIVYKEDTLMYVCNHSDGWMIISGDKRLQPVIATGNAKRFDVDNLPDGIRVWLDSYAEDIYNCKNNKEPIENENTLFWEMFLSSKDLLYYQTKSGPEMKWYAIDYGPYVSSTSTTDIVPHLVSVKWGQESPWNSKCPIDASNGNRCVLGCAAVAVSQLLHYTNTYLGRPTRLYHTINCSIDTIYNATTNIGFSRSNLHSISSRWDDMALNKYGSSSGIEYAEDLMLDVGNRFAMKYSSSGSSTSIPAHLSDLRDYYDLNCSSGNYSSSTVMTSLNNSMPVLITAFSERGGFLNLGYRRGHGWLIDGIRRVTKNCYFIRQFEYSELWPHYTEVYDSFDEITSVYGITDPNQSVIVREYTSSNDYLLMNWGYNGEWDDDLFSPYENANWPANNGNHQYQRKIFYGFN